MEDQEKPQTWNVGLVISGYTFMCDREFTTEEKDELVSALKEKVGYAYFARPSLTE